MQKAVLIFWNNHVDTTSQEETLMRTYCVHVSYSIVINGHLFVQISPKQGGVATQNFARIILLGSTTYRINFIKKLVEHVYKHPSLVPVSTALQPGTARCHCWRKRSYRALPMGS